MLFTGEHAQLSLTTVTFIFVLARLTNDHLYIKRNKALRCTPKTRGCNTLEGDTVPSGQIVGIIRNKHDESVTVQEGEAAACLCCKEKAPCGQ